MTANHVPPTQRAAKPVLKADLGAPSRSPSPAATARTQPTQEEIRVRAFEIYQARGGRPGDARDDWEQARRDLQARAAKPE